jgi:hypothetical protein
LVVAAAAIVVVAAAFFSGYGPFQTTTTREEDFSDFTKIDIGSAFQVEITQSESYSIKITTDRKTMKNVQVARTGETLTIGIKPGVQVQAFTLIAEITMPELHELSFSGATQGSAKGFSSTQNLTLILSGASSLNTDITSGEAEIKISGASNLKGKLTASGDADLLISGASTVELPGGAEDLDIKEGSGASIFKLEDFSVKNVNINLSGASRATIKLDGRLDANISGASNLYYIGEPTMGDITTSSGSTISPK